MAGAMLRGVLLCRDYACAAGYWAPSMPLPTHHEALQYHMQYKYVYILLCFLLS